MPAFVWVLIFICLPSFLWRSFFVVWLSRAAPSRLVNLGVVIRSRSGHLQTKVQLCLMKFIVGFRSCWVRVSLYRDIPSGAPSGGPCRRQETPVPAQGQTWLKHLVADQMLDIQALRIAAAKKW
jgi:hypothetical protein